MLATALAIAALLLTLATGTFWVRALIRVALPTNRSYFLVMFLLAGALGAVALAIGPGWIGGVLAGFSVFVALFFAFTLVIGDQKVGADVIHVGASLPKFSAVDEHGETFNSVTLAGNTVLIKFFRGHW
ncbi:MAG: hypothetical protein ACI9GW_000895 [Halieaceae bacterium]|jgi:hypothetical protein